MRRGKYEFRVIAWKGETRFLCRKTDSDWFILHEGYSKDLNLCKHLMTFDQKEAEKFYAKVCRPTDWSGLRLLFWVMVIFWTFIILLLNVVPILWRYFGL